MSLGIQNLYQCHEHLVSCGHFSLKNVGVCYFLDFDKNSSICNIMKYPWLGSFSVFVPPIGWFWRFNP